MAFTGPSSLSGPQTDAVAETLKGMVAIYRNQWAYWGRHIVWRSGAQFGVDTIVVEQAVKLGVRFELWVPAACYNTKLVEGTKNWADHVIECPERREPYRIRNNLMVKGRLARPKADLLVAFLRQPTFYRSGEWMTVNIAQKAGVRIRKHLL